MLPRTRSALWILLFAITACTTSPADPGVRRLQAPQPTAEPSPSPIQQALPFLAKIGLTPAQTQQIEAIMRKRWPTPDQAETQQDGKDYQAAMLAETVDQDRLRTLLAKSEASQRKSSLALVAVLNDVRPLLSAQQRAKAAAGLLTPPKPAPQPSPTAPPSPTPEEQALALTDEQQGLFSALQAPEGDAQAVPKAIAGLLTSGDSKPLTKALTPTRSLDEQVDATVAAMASLTAAQRKAMFASDQEDDAAG
ncbi:MAG: hypothetical protein JWM80_1026 [Cyanobacteria bacterium RYN_339]|nr:hypothetical protein [Cyanobacteria bacterium RYN_339]